MAYVQLHELAGREFACQITPYTTIADLKRHVEQETGVNSSMIQLRHQGIDLGLDCNAGLMNKLHEIDSSLLVPPALKEFTKLPAEDSHQHKYVDLEVLYDLGGGCLTVYRWRCWCCFIVEFDIANGCTECGICSNKIASRCKDDGCAVDCFCEQCSCECCVGTCTIL